MTGKWIQQPCTNSGSTLCVVLLTYAFTRVRERQKKSKGKFITCEWELVGLKVNPWYFGHDIYTPESKEGGDPFTIGRAIHSNRLGTLDGWIGGVAVYDRALGAEEMRRLSEIGTGDGSPVIHLDAIIHGNNGD